MTYQVNLMRTLTNTLPMNRGGGERGRGRERVHVHTCSPSSEREIWPKLKNSNISKTIKGTPTKLGVHTFHINPYMHEFFEPILFD